MTSACPAGGDSIPQHRHVLATSDLGYELCEIRLWETIRAGQGREESVCVRGGRRRRGGDICDFRHTAEDEELGKGGGGEPCGERVRARH
eukprot:746919-Hanusia_phi.AAC.2